MQMWLAGVGAWPICDIYIYMKSLDAKASQSHFSGSYADVQLFYFNGNEINLCIF